jgi:hypothetical protein
MVYLHQVKNKKPSGMEGFGYAEKDQNGLPKLKKPISRKRKVRVVSSSSQGKADRFHKCIGHDYRRDFDSVKALDRDDFLSIIR